MDSGEGNDGTNLGGAGEYQNNYPHPLYLQQQYGEGYNRMPRNVRGRRYNHNYYNTDINNSRSGVSSSEDDGDGMFVGNMNPQQRYSYEQNPYKYAQGGDRLAVYCFGRGEDGQLGLGDTSAHDEPIYVDSLRGIGVKDVACGSGHTVVLTVDGEIMSWGRGDDGRLGQNSFEWKYVPRSVVALQGISITHITCGSYHTAAVSSNGELYTWGGGMYGKLGHGNERGHSQPKRVEALVGAIVSSVACGSRHTAIVTSKGKVYSWGDRENGVAGHSDPEGHQYTPKIIEALDNEKVTQISACGFHTGCLTEDGKVYTWGEGKFGRLGSGNERHCTSPRIVESFVGQSPTQIACGGFHSAVITADGRLATFGGGEHGQLGHGNFSNKLKPAFVKALEGVFISQISCGWSHTVALSSNGQVFTWGNNDHGKLGLGSRKKASSPQLVEKLQDQNVVKIASYNEHTAVLVKMDDCLADSLVSVSSSFVNEMKKLVNNEEFSDVIFQVEDQPIYAHRAVLVQRSAHFSAMFRSGMREATERKVVIQGVSFSVFLLLMEYIYTDSVEIDPEHAIGLFVVADLYQLDRLKEVCKTIMKRNINCENAAMMLQEASDANCEVLKEICMDFIVNNFDYISKTEGIKLISHSMLIDILARRP